MEITSFTRHCGTKILSDFWIPNKVPSVYSSTKTIIGIFIDDPDQKKSYEKVCKQYKILYQSPVLSRSPSDGRDYFIVIWLNEKP